MEKNQIYDSLLKELPEEQVKVDEPMKNHTSFKIGGNADVYVVAKEIKQVKSVLSIAKEFGVPITVLGNGSNILVGDKGIRGLVLKIDINKFEIERKKEDAIIKVGAGVPLGKIGYELLKEEITGFEFACGIPGNLGGAVRMNAGAYGGEMKDCIETVTCINKDGELKELSKDECEFSYRHSIFCNKELVVVEAKLRLPYGKKENIKLKMDEDAKNRKSKQPLNFPSAGSTFKRGEDFIAAKLIDECGLKGYAVGGAQVSTLHAGFIINTGNATANDVLQVVEHVKKEVLAKTRKKIEMEVELLGEF